MSGMSDYILLTGRIDELIDTIYNTLITANSNQTYPINIEIWLTAINYLYFIVQHGPLIYLYYIFQHGPLIIILHLSTWSIDNYITSFNMVH